MDTEVHAGLNETRINKRITTEYSKDVTWSYIYYKNWRDL
jgi:hypothetical protein